MQCGRAWAAVPVQLRLSSEVGFSGAREAAVGFRLGGLVLVVRVTGLTICVLSWCCGLG